MDGETAVVFMGHGTEAESNSTYAKMQEVLTAGGYEDYFVGTVEASPTVEDVLAELRRLKRCVAIDADAIAKEAGSARASNIVMLGAASTFIDIPFERIEDGIRALFGRKGNEVVEMNLKALRAGREHSEKMR